MINKVVWFRERELLCNFNRDLRLRIFYKADVEAKICDSPSFPTGGKKEYLLLCDREESKGTMSLMQTMEMPKKGIFQKRPFNVRDTVLT